jgi:hypothetical protein
VAGRIEHIHAKDELVGGHLALHEGRERAELGKLHADVERGLHRVLDAPADHEHTLPDDLAEGALVLEEVQERGHADGEEADQQRDQDEPDAYRAHALRPALYVVLPFIVSRNLAKP